MAGSSLKSFIKDVRNSKTLAEERSIITKESAKIRTRLRDDHLPSEKRRKNIQKLLYLYILGEKTHFGQVECINLVASDDFADKRLGYLSAMLLLDESQDLLTLLTNVLNNDLNNNNKYVVSLALTTLGFLSSSELARDVFPDVENLLSHSRDPYLVKKALQCTAKMIHKDVSLLDIFSPQLITGILNNHSMCTHGVLLGIIKVFQSILESYGPYQEYLADGEVEGGESKDSDEEFVSKILSPIIPVIPQLFQLMQNLNSKNFEPDFDVQGICDPFLQVELINTLRLFFQLGDELDCHEIMQYLNKLSDLLTQVATNTDSSKSTGQTILYETTRIIFSLNLDQPLRVLGVNILAKFLSGRDNNVKYVALNTLLKVVPLEPSAVQRHRKFISRCLRDPDVFIRKRALELTFAILDEANITEVVDELLHFLERTTEEDRSLILFTVEHLVAVFDKYSIADEKWELGVFVKILKLVGKHIALEKVSDILVAINNAKNSTGKRDVLIDMLRYSLDEKLSFEISQENIAWQLVSIWCIGEYGDMILEGAANPLINQKSLTQYLSNCNLKYSEDNRLIQYILTAALKLSVRIDDTKCVEDLRQLIVKHTSDPDLMLQNKSVQYEIIFRQPRSVKKALLETMPNFDKPTKHEKVTSTQSRKPKVNPPKEANLLFDLLQDNPSQESHDSNTNADVGQTDLLADLFGSSQPNNKAAESDPRGIGLLSQSASETVKLPAQGVKIHEDVYLQVFAHTISCVSGAAQLELYFKALKQVSEIQSMCAVPKTQKLVMGQLHPQNSLKEDDVCKQSLKVTGSGKLKLRVKANFKVNGRTIDKQFDYKFNGSL
ncbi:APL4 (YPR029C) [Zygosaccharomyces parabailii]|nr:APL4 (YPR029C) [Zygosaccharomyces parabailii]CDH11541.1 related to AP-1 complex subunit gamma-1 [Zygosaccharomyces bailii ISA1307]